MKNLFKEVWKSFSKSKIILTGLTLLVFLTSGIITLLSDVVSKYNQQYDEYKQTSQLHDITMSSNINPSGTKPRDNEGKDLIYLPNQYKSNQNMVNNIWKFEDKNQHIESIRIDTNNKFYDLHDLNKTYPIDTLVSTKDLSYLINSNLSSITIPNDGVSTSIFTPNKNQTNQLVIFDKNTKTILKTNINTIKSINKVEKKKSLVGPIFKIVKTNNISDLLNLTKDDFSALLVDKDGNAYIEDDNFLDPNSKVDVAKQYQSQPLSLFRIDKRQVANLFGFKRETIYESSQYKFSQYEGIGQLINGDLSNINSINQLQTYTFNDNFNLSLNNTFKNGVDVTNTIELLPKNKLTIPNSWFVYAKDVYRFERFQYKFNDNLNQWSGIYREYLDSIKPDKPNQSNPEWDYLTKNLSYWNKTITTELVDFNNQTIHTGKPLKIAITKDDLSLKLVNESNPGLEQTLLQIEGISDQNPTSDLAIKLNTDFRSEKQTKIENNSKKHAYGQMYEQIKKVVDKIGIRENLTVNSNEGSTTNVYHFINLGKQVTNSDGTKSNQINWNGIGIDQEVGKLVSNADSSQIYSIGSNLNSSSKSIPQDQIPKILDKLLTGLSLDRKYINPMTSFQTFNYLENGVLKSQSNAKIVWLTPNGVNDRSQLVGLSTIRNTVDGTKKYYVLHEKNQGLLDWELKDNLVFSNNEDMANYVISNKLQFAPFDVNNNPINVIGDNGWLAQNSNYQDQFYVPFQYLLPSAEIIEQFNKEGTLQIFADNLILKLTQNVRPIISATNWELLMNAVSSGFSAAGFGNGLTPPAAITTQTIANIVVFTLRDAVVATNQNFANSFFTDIFSGIQRQMSEYANGDIIKQKEYLKNEFSKLGSILKITTGIDLAAIVLPLIDSSLKDPNMFLEAIKQIINAFDLDQAIIDLYEAMNSPYRLKDEILTSADYLPVIYKNLKNSSSIKLGLANLIKSLGITGLDRIINLVKFENPAIGYSKLVEQIRYERVAWGSGDDAFVEDHTATIKVIGDNSLKSFLNLISFVVGIGSLIPENMLPNIDVIYDPSFLNPLELDLDLLWFLKNYVLTEKEGTLFGVSTMGILQDATDGFTQIKNDGNHITYNENASKIAIVNEAFLKENNKSVYHSDTLLEDLNDLSKIDDKYKISVSNVEYVITGTNLTVDYMYPIINSENIQVNTKNQALVYVNQYGFDRIRRSNVNSPYDKYFLFKGTKGNNTLEQTQEHLNQIAYYWITGGGTIDPTIANSDDNPYKKAFLYDEYQVKNPEYSMRISTIEKLLDIFPKIQLFVALTLGLITAIVISFVIRRYISSRSKAIGILKAQGYSSMKIAFSICLFPLIVSLIGGSFGYIWGHFAQLGIFQLLSIFWTIPIATASFNWVTLVISIVVPFVLLSLLTIVVTLWFLRKNSIILMNGSLEVNDSQFAIHTKKAIQKTSIKNKFSSSLALSSIGKLVALFISALITSTITLFAITSFNIFDKSVSKTYENKRFTYKTDLSTPSIEGGEYSNIYLNDKTDISKNLYVPLGLVEEGYTYLNNYFKPGHNSVINQKLEVFDTNGNKVLIDANGKLDINDTSTPHIFTKSSIDLTVLAGGLSINVWENLYNAIPESQRASIIKKSQDSALWLEWTQEGKTFVDSKTNKKYITRFVNFGNKASEYLTVFDPITNQNIPVWNSSSKKYEDVRIPYFNYMKNNINPEKSRFEYRKVTDVNSKYFDSKLILDGDVNNNTTRQAYREFLVDGYNLMFNWNGKLEELPFARAEMPTYTIDYFIMPGANLLFNPQSENGDETYTYIDSTLTNNFQKIRIYGYKPNSKYIKVLDSNKNDLLEEIDKFDLSNNIYPIVVNEVVRQKYNINVGSELEVIIDNHYLRNQEKLRNALNKANNIDKVVEPKKVKLKVIGILDTYINEEWVTTQEISNMLLGISSYNGILTNNSDPIQLANSLSLYSPNGYWSANESIDNIEPSSLSSSQAEDLKNVYKQLFYVANEKEYNDANKNLSLVANNIRAINPNLSNQEVNLAIKSLLDLDPSASLETSDKNFVYNAINKFSDIYTNKSLQASLHSATSNGIEKEYAKNASSTINNGMLIIVLISFLISLIILVTISVMIINENERNIAIFGILGYSTSEKIRMFFSIYVPIVLVSIILSVLFVWLFIPLFASSVLTTSSIALPLKLSFVKVIISSLVVATIFSITCIVAWIIQGRINPITLLKGD